MEREDLLCLIVIIVIVASVAGFFGYDKYTDWRESEEHEEKRSKLFIEDGDRVTFEVSAWLEDGRYFYTTEKEVDEDETIPKTANYNFFTDEPEFATVGEELKSKFNVGFDEQIHYMKIDEEKQFKVTPDKGYGWRNDSLVKTIPLHDTLPLYVEQDHLEFQGLYNPTDIPLFIGQRFNHVYWQWPIELVEVNNDTITYRHEPDVNWNIEVLPWAASVSGISEKDNVLMIEHKVTYNEIYSTVDPIELTDYDEGYLEVQDIQSEIGIGPVPGVIVDVGLNEFTIDFNDERAGVNIFYKVTIVNIEKA
jgi:FKBP-type peptidyl-prolyl cis-trans isomerase 2